VVEHVEMYALAKEQKRRHGFLCQSLLSSEEDAFKELHEVVFVKRLIAVHNLNGFLQHYVTNAFSFNRLL
jgi:hypothetical protein